VPALIVATGTTDMAVSVFEITRLAKTGGPLTKRIDLLPDGNTKSDGSTCVMSAGTATRVHLEGVAQLADLIGSLEPHEAITLGALRSDLPDKTDIVTKRGLGQLNGAAAPGTIARTGEFIAYRQGRSAFVLLDYDTKGLPSAVKERLKALGGFARAVASVMPEIGQSARLIRQSTSAGLSRVTGETVPGSDGMHLYVAVQDGADIERFLPILHARCWLAGLGWLTIGESGQFLERSIVDRMVAAPERIVFEGAPVLGDGLVQDAAARRPKVRDGAALDTALCHALTILDGATLKELRAKERSRLAPDSAKARTSFIEKQATKIVELRGISHQHALRVAERQAAGVLLPNVVLPFDDADLAGITVADVLADPGKYEGETLADPIEGVDYGLGKAKVMRRADGSPWIHSFAHGRTAYELRYDAVAIAAAIEKAPKADAGNLFVALALRSDLDIEETERLRDIAGERAKVGKRTLSNKLKAATKARNADDAAERQQRQLADRRDTRPQIPAPLADAPWIPQMELLNDVLGSSREPEPPMRNVEGNLVHVRVRRIPDMHALTPAGTNEGDAAETRLPAPELPLLTRLSEPQAAEMIERYIDYVSGENLQSVHLAAPFVRHFIDRTDNVLPLVAAVVTLPMVLSDGTVLGGNGLIGDRGIVARIPAELAAYIPTAKQCQPNAVKNAMKFLIEEWLVDVATDFTGKCVLLAAALTMIERSLLSDRPAFFVTAGRRGGGKTTTLVMLLTAITGVRPAAAAWSPNEEERRKALLSYLMEGLPCIIWDNIPRGSQLSCPHIERACTTAFYSDRRLGASEMVTVPASTVHLFTGNNVGPRGDLASRSLIARLEVDRADPENREFNHADPIAWTEANRGRILCAVFTLLLGNPDLRAKPHPPQKTRFKLWMLLVGRAIENGAKQIGQTIDFAELFVRQEEDDEDGAALGDVLEAMASAWPSKDWKKGDKFTAAELAMVLNDRSEYATNEALELSATIRDFLYPDTPHSQTVGAKSLGKALKKHVGEPVRHGTRTLILKEYKDPRGGPNGTLSYYIAGA